jgi:putative membrane protein
MKIKIILAASAIFALGACGDNDQGGGDANLAMDNMAMDGGNEFDLNGMGPDESQTAANGQQYAAMAAASDMFEIESSRLALEKAQDAGIKELARMLITDHEKSTADLKRAAGEARPAIDVAPQMNEEQQSNMQALRSANGAQFDRTWLQQQVMAHQKALSLVQGYAGNGEVASLKAHASAVSGPIQRHLERAQQLSQQGQ